jgi:hypothetical protein
MNIVLKIKALIVLMICMSCNQEDSSFYKHIQISSLIDNNPVIEHMVSISSLRIAERCGAKVGEKDDNTLKIILDIEKGIGSEGFIIEDVEGGVKVTGNDERGLLYGVGKLLHTSCYTKNGFTPGEWRGTSSPEKSIRGIYFATHFYNFYQVAPIKEIERYLEDLALWGTNNIMLWFDIHHFKNENDPEALAFLERLKQIANAARKVKMDISFLMLANEGYGESPEELRAKSGGARGGVYFTEICPSVNGGMEYIENTKADFFDQIKELQPDYICLWPYDQGGCGCKDCLPWGTNGFIRISKKLSKLAKQKLEGTKIILSTWLFDREEWESLNEELAKKKNWVDIILDENQFNSQKGDYESSPGNLPVIRFPEISMYNTFPWGGFGATPIPKHIQQSFNTSSKRVIGGFPYSEGIYEDINKVVCGQLFWNSNQSLDDILKEYVNYEFSSEFTDSLVKVIHTLEQNHHFRWWPDMLKGVKLTLDWFPCKDTKVQEDPGAEQAYSIMKTVDNQLSDYAKNSWRWRMLFIRTMLDAELKTNGGRPNEKCYEGFRELAKIYHASAKTDPCVRPPVKEAGY